MKALRCTAPGKLDYQDTVIPVPIENQTLIHIKRVGVCGTDLHAYEGTQPYFTYPRILGHELAATIIETDNPSFKVGDAVAIIPYFHCGSCVACRCGKTNCCEKMQVSGVHIDGGMTERLVVPSSALLAGNGLGYDELAMVEPLAIGAHGVRRASVQAGEFVLVVGAGPIGMGAMQFAQIAGAHVIAMDVNDDRLSFCTRKLHVAHTVNPATENPVEKLKAITNGDMPTVVIDATGNLKAINTAFQYMAHGGRYVLIGLQKGDICFSHPEFHKREATLMSSRNATRADFEQVMSVIQQRLIDPSNYITHRVHFDRVASEFESWLDPTTGVIKAMIIMP